MGTDFDINEAKFSGTVETFRRIETKTGTPMIRFAFRCWKEAIHAVAFKDVAAQTTLAPGDRVKVRGRVRGTSWQDSEGNQRGGWEVVADEITASPSERQAQPQQQAIPLRRQAERPGVMAAHADEEPLPF